VKEAVCFVFANLVYQIFKQRLLEVVMRRFMKAEVVKGIGEDLIKVDLDDASIQLGLAEINYGNGVLETIARLKSSVMKERLKKEIQVAYIKLTKYLQQNLPLDNPILLTVRCLNPIFRQDSWTKEAIKTLCKLMPQAIEKDMVII
jgi:hypothetical protein